MPELPEVETVVRNLKKIVLNKKIIGIDVYYGKQIHGDIYSIVNKEILDIKRRGKNIIFCFDSLYMIVHLRMEGKFFIKDKNEEINKHEHVVFHFDSFDLRYHDTRKFGEIIVKGNDSLDIGIEATNITRESLEINRPIKEILLNQKIIAGIGNIYADEICYYAKVMPDEVINESKYDLIIQGAKEILEKSILCGGCTIRTYNSLGTKGTYQDYLCVHTLKRCKKCGSLICKKTVAGRSSYYCPRCQKDNILIGLTGGISTGKSTVGKMLMEMNYHLIDSDLIVKDLWEKEEVKNKIKLMFDLENVDKKTVSNIIFNDKEKREMLNRYLHPLVKKEIFKEMKKGINFIDVPLLFESGFDSFCDYTICVYLDDFLAIKRLMERNDLTYEEAKKRVESQMPIKEKRRKSTFCIDNSLSVDDTRKQLIIILKEFSYAFSEK